MRGELVALDQVVVHTFYTVYPNQRDVSFNIFCTVDNNEKLTTDSSMRRLATMELELPGPHSAEQRELKARDPTQGRGSRCIRAAQA